MGDAERDDTLLDDLIDPAETPTFYPEAGGADLFGEESDDEGQLPPETQQLDNLEALETQAFDTQPFDTQPVEPPAYNDTQAIEPNLADTQPVEPPVQPEEGNPQAASQAEDVGALDGFEGAAAEETHVDEEAEQADYAEPQAEEEAVEAEEAPVATKGEHDDIFASDSDDEGAPQAQGHQSEAEDEDEEDEFEAMFKSAAGKKRKRPEGRTADMVMAVESLIANMEVAAEMDISENEKGKPAVHKLKMLPEVEDKLAQSVLHRELLDGGILGAMKLWIELMLDGSLPNVKVRTAVFRMLQKLPIDLSLEGRKEQLRKSELGKYVMFYSRLPDETLTNRQAARALVEKWSRPILDQYRESAQSEEMQERENRLAIQRKRRKQELEADKPNPIAYKDLKPGDPGFRWHASVPAPAQLDYMRRPDSSVATEGEAVRGRAKPKDKMSKKLAAMSRKGAKKGGAEGKVSLQGRGLLL